MTVSRVINRQDNVTDETRALVQTAIDRLNYAPSHVARSLAGLDHYRLGVLYNNSSAAFLGEFLLGALDECSKTGHQLLVEHCGHSPPAEKAALERLLASGVDGLILPPPLCETRSILGRVAKVGMAMVAVAAGQTGGDCASVRIDTRKAARKMTAHLLELGHRRIGFITGDPRQSVSDQILRGFLDTLRETGLLQPPELIEQGCFDYRSGMAAAERLLTRTPRPTAIFAANDDMAAGVVAVATRLRLRVPEDLSVAGFDDTPISSIICPTLTTIRQPISAMGRVAVELLLSEVKRLRDHDGRPPATAILGHVLIRRQSTTAPGGAGA
jgi:LacI family transcriptional regulator